MKVTSTFAMTVLALIVLLGSCTIQKRSYRPGLTIDWRGNTLHATTRTTEEMTPGSLYKNATSTSSIIANENHSNDALVSSLTPSKESISNECKSSESVFKTTPSNTSGHVLKRISIPKRVPFLSPIKMKKERSATTAHNKNSRDVLNSVVGIILLGIIVSLLVMGILIGFALILKISLFLLFLILICYLIYVFSLALL